MHAMSHLMQCAIRSPMARSEARRTCPSAGSFAPLRSPPGGLLRLRMGRRMSDGSELCDWVAPSGQGRADTGPPLPPSIAPVRLSENSRIVLRLLAMFCAILWINHILACVWFMIGTLAPSDTDQHWTSAVVHFGGQAVTIRDAPSSYQYTTAYTRGHRNHAWQLDRAVLQHFLSAARSSLRQYLDLCVVSDDGRPADVAPGAHPSVTASAPLLVGERCQQQFGDAGSGVSLGVCSRCLPQEVDQRGRPAGLNSALTVRGFARNLSLSAGTSSMFATPVSATMHV